MIDRVVIVRVHTPNGQLAVRVQGDPRAPAVLMTHSILSDGSMWDAQAALLAARGWRVLRPDTRGHGASQTPDAPYAMADLVADHIEVLDAMNVVRVHYIGLSLGGMSGFGLALAHPDRLKSLLLCDARADMPPAAAAPWPERIASARAHGCAALAESTVERWFGKPYVDANPAIAQHFVARVSATSTEGFVGCAQALLGLDYLAQVSRITTPLTLLVGANDGPLPQTMRELQGLVPDAALEVIEGAGHLPNIDQPAAFDAALLRHLERNATKAQR